MFFKPQDFESMLYNVVALDRKKPVCIFFEDLAVFKKYSKDVEEQTLLEFDKVMRYIILLYERNTPLTVIDKFTLRKTKAAEYAGFDIIKGKEGEPTFPKQVLKLISTPCEYETVNRIIVLFLRFHRSHKFSTHRLYNEMYYGAAEKIMNGEYTKAHKELLDMLTNDMESSHFDLFQTKSIDETLKEEMEMVMFEEAIGLNPEDMAKRLQEGKYFSLRNYATARK
jgi:hypothetical protein